MIDAALRRAYLATRYVVTDGENRAPIEIGVATPELDRLLAARSVATAAFVTAWNPRSDLLAPAENLRRASELTLAVQALGLDALPVATTAEDARWIEHGLLILGISQTRACSLGRRFGQNAIVMVSRGTAPRLIELVSPDEAS